MLTRLLRPDFQLSRVLDLDGARLRAVGIHGLLLDLDGTLKDHGSGQIPNPILAWAEHLLDDGFRLCLLSNGKHRRIAEFAKVLRVPFVALAFKPFPFGCRRALGLLDLDPSQVAVIGDQIFADVLAGRLAGLRTILVPPTHAVCDEPWFTRIKRPAERWLLRRWTRPTMAIQEL